MKLSPIAMGLAIACAGTAAQAQSNVQIFGLIDTNVTHLSSSGAGSVTRLGTDGNQSSRIGFRGTEDLGGGLKAGFWLEAAINPDVGTGGSTSADNLKNQSGGLTFGRRSTVSLMGKWGELRLGRDYTPGFWNLSKYSAFGTNGVGSSASLFYPVKARITHVRASNSVGYHLPKMGGLFGQVMVARGEQTGNSDGNVVGARLGYGSGPFSVAVGTTKTTIAALGDFRQTNIGGSYDFGVAEVMVLWNENKIGDTKTRSQSVGVQVPVGAAGEIRATLGTVNATNIANDASHFAIGYVHKLSKRTVLYTSYGRVKNKDNGTAYTLSSVDADAVTRPGGSSTGFEFGIRHNF
jgi:predicted porin